MNRTVVWPYRQKIVEDITTKMTFMVSSISTVPQPTSLSANYEILFQNHVVLDKYVERKKQLASMFLKLDNL